MQVKAGPRLGLVVRGECNYLSPMKSSVHLVTAKVASLAIIFTSGSARIIALIRD